MSTQEDGDDGSTAPASAPQAEAALGAFIDSHADQLVRAAQALVRAPSPNPPGDVAAAARAAAALLAELVPAAEVSTYETAPGVVNLVAVLRGGGGGEGRGRRLVFSGHLDTYPFGDEDAWDLAPTSGALVEKTAAAAAEGPGDDGPRRRIYGRGAADMKGGIAASIVAMAALAAAAAAAEGDGVEGGGDAWRGEVVLALAGDEETMGTLGSAWLLDHVEAVRGCDAMICGDAGSPLVVRTGEKGLLWLELEARGSPAHGAHVHRGDNAIDRLLAAIAAVKRLEESGAFFPEDHDDDDVNAAIDAAAPVSEPLFGPGEAATLKRLTVNVGTIQGGTSMNLVPDRARAAADIRILMGLTAAAVARRVAELLDDDDDDDDPHDPNPGVRHRVIRQYDPTWTPPASSRAARCALGAARRVVGPRAAPGMRVGASDARLFRARGVPSVVVGLTPHGMGGPNEFLDVDELAQVAKIHAYAALEFLRGEGEGE